jgi:hypothetical protein
MRIAAGVEASRKIVAAQPSRGPLPDYPSAEDIAEWHRQGEDRDGNIA